MDFPTSTSTRKSARRSASNLLASQSSTTSSSNDATSETSNKEDDAQLDTASTISASSVSGSSTRSSSSSKSSSMSSSSSKSLKSKASNGSAAKRSSNKNSQIEQENTESSTSKEVAKEESMASNSSSADVSFSSTTITTSVNEQTVIPGANTKRAKSSIKIEKIIQKINTNVNSNSICQTTTSIEAEATSISSEPAVVETAGVGEKRKLSDIDVDVVNDEPKTNSSESNQDETSDSLGPLSSAHLLKSDDNSNSQNEASSEPKKKRRRRGSIIGFQEQNSSMPIASVSQLFIYNWPLEEDENGNTNNSNNLIYATSPNCYVLQEQISEYLGIKSFKRKYPDIFRRVIDLKEREHLKDNKVVTEAQCDLGLTALRLSECLDIMAEEYHDKYVEFTNYITEKRRRMIAEATMSKNAQVSPVADASSNATSSTVPSKPIRPPLSEAEKLKEQMRKAMKSASSYNMMLQREKREERYSYFDIQTMRIQKPLTTKQQNLNTTLQITNGYYPVSLLQGQYQNYYKKYTNEELKYLPLNTVIETPAIPDPYSYDEWKKSELVKASKSGINGDKNMENSSDDERVLRMNGIGSNQLIANNSLANQNNQFLTKPSNLLSTSVLNTPISNHQTINAARSATNATPTIAKLIHSNSSQKLNSISIKTESSSSSGSQVSKVCYVCTKTSFGSSADQIMISCSSCSRSSHQVCLELNPELIDWQYIRSYPWQCMDCKKCSTCNNPHDEDKMMFCDRCDRGFHTYCVGVGDVPSGSWFCKTCSQSSRNTPKHYRQSVDGFDASFSNTFSPSTPQENRIVVHGRRGRPPGSLNKPKDPNNPKYFNKLNKTKSGELAMFQ